MIASPRTFVLAALFNGLLLSSALAQPDQARVTGRVSDASGGALPGVTVTIVSTQRGQPVTVVTDDVGRYISPPLPAGTYTVLFELSGFETRARPGVELHAGDMTTVDGNLAVAGLSETVQVVAEAP